MSKKNHHFFPDPLKERSRPFLASDLKNWNVGDWAPTKERGYLVKTGQKGKNIPQLSVFDNQKNFLGKTTGLNFKGKSLF